MIIWLTWLWVNTNPCFWLDSSDLDSFSLGYETVLICKMLTKNKINKYTKNYRQYHKGQIPFLSPVGTLITTKSIPEKCYHWNFITLLHGIDFSTVKQFSFAHSHLKNIYNSNHFGVFNLLEEKSWWYRSAIKNAP